MGTTQTKDTCTWGTKGSGLGQFDTPGGIAVDENGEVYVADCGNARVQCFSSDGKFLRAWGKLGKGDGEFGRPHRISTGRCNSLYPPALACMGRVPPLSSFPPGILPLCAAYLGSTLVCVTDAVLHRIQVFLGDGRFVRTICELEKSYIPRPNTLPYIRGCAIGLDGTITAVVDAPLGLRRFVSDDSIPSGREDKAIRFRRRFQDPTEVAAGRNGLLFVTDGGDGSVHCIRSNGTRIHKWNVYGTLAQLGRRLIWPAVNVYDTVYIADTETQHILAFEADGTFINRVPLGENLSGSRSVPIGIACGPGGVLYVTDRQNHRVIVLSASIWSRPPPDVQATNGRPPFPTY